MKKEYSVRKEIRLKKYDYLQNGLYFITICTKDKIPYLCEIKGVPISAPTIPVIISSFKRYVSKNSGIKIWQRSYYDHIIRNKKEFIEICRYIENNPLNWINNNFNQNKWSGTAGAKWR